jgi:hypothetical protein
MKMTVREEEQHMATTTTTTSEEQRCSTSNPRTTHESGRKFGVDELRKPLKLIEKRMKKRSKKSAVTEAMMRERRPSIDWAFWWSSATKSACMPVTLPRREDAESGQNTHDEHREEEDKTAHRGGAAAWTLLQLELVSNSLLFSPEFRGRRRVEQDGPVTLYKS